MCTNKYRHTMRSEHNHRSPIDQSLAVKLRHARVNRGETQEDVARRAGLTVAAYARIERGSADPKWTTVRSLAEVLEVNLARLDARSHSKAV